MLNKHLFFLLFFLALLCAGVEPKSPTRESLQQEIRKLLRQDPRTPRLSVSKIETSLRFMEDLLKQDLPKTCKAYVASKKVPTPFQLEVFLKKYRKLVSDKELEEVTGKSLVWYNNLGSVLVKLYSPILAMNATAAKNDDTLYVQACQAYYKEVENLRSVLQRPISLPQKELNALKAQNTQIRKKDIQKRLQILEQKRRQLR